MKPILRWASAPVGARPIAPGRHRFQWLCVTAFVSPATGENFWRISSGVSKPFFEVLLATFAREAGAGRDRIIVLALDNAGWRSETNFAVPDALRASRRRPTNPKGQSQLPLPPAHRQYELIARKLYHTCRYALTAGLDARKERHAALSAAFARFATVKEAYRTAKGDEKRLSGAVGEPISADRWRPQAHAERRRRSVCGLFFDRRAAAVLIAASKSARNGIAMANLCRSPP